jgi:hypothetical protein
MRVSHETVYQSIYLYPRGGLRASCRLACGRHAPRVAAAAGGDARRIVDAAWIA